MGRRGHTGRGERGREVERTLVGEQSSDRGRRGSPCDVRQSLRARLAVLHARFEDLVPAGTVVRYEVDVRRFTEIKRAVYQGSEVHLEGGLEIEAEAFLRTIETDDASAEDIIRNALRQVAN